MASATGENFFEGTEKLLEVWFTSSREETKPDLRTIQRSEWVKLLNLVQCEIISCTQIDDMDSYVLSESSMFVTERRFILKTCGTTTLLLAIEPLLKLVKEKCGFDNVADIFYSRKNFMQPDKQHGIHRTFENEVEHLDTLFKNGAAYTLGRINRDCWYLYTMDEVGVSQPDQTVELLMWDLCPEKMAVFTKETCSDGKEAREKSGIDKIIPGAKIDDFLFEPCGYSMNGLLPDGQYITIHVTPEPNCSYVSFESNVPQESYTGLINRVLNTFKPGKVLMTIFANKESTAKDCHKDLDTFLDQTQYNRVDHQFCTFKNYNLTYTYFTSRPVI
ncbi:S-adenosylmethionine decarboxylase proenzyme 1-like isoform X2 [Ruditapes philippinarum]|uniref:S-adenosylmethionine decarboxylase proenzyme 1-like isoform X2 n=1 Tax=Ruditapes philippinarum TaxID=129788 RepID=UPI00295BC3F4|nr:S-adenosylmethionine decarboxylase proenzyme 1-like isoform X2 [Ruditapes philippinarum]